MSQILVSIIAFVVAIAVLVAVHEFGHYWVARRLGIKVLRFSIGFGRPIWTRIAGPDQTEYVVSNIPLGGYVKMLDEREGPVAPEDRGRAFNHKPVWARMAVLVAGPAFNFLFAILAYWVIFMAGVPGVRPVVGPVAPDSIAAVAGVRANDEIRAVGATRTATWEAALLAILDGMLDDKRVALTLRDPDGAQRSVVLEVGDRVSELTEPGALLPGLGLEPWSPTIPALLESVEAGGPAAESGFEANDLVVEADGAAVTSWNQWRDYLRERPGEVVEAVVERAGQRVDIRLRIGSAESGGETVGWIGARAAYPEGITDHMLAEQRYGPVAALAAGSAKTWEMTTLTLRMFGRMIMGDVSLKNISGPINIAQYAGYTASAGGVSFLSFLAIVSISLGILNLLPIPVLDGGQLVYQFVELVKGSPLSQRAEIVGQQIGLALLLLLMTFAFYNDIARLVG